MEELDACYFCHNKWGKCTCEFEGEFEWECFLITEPNVSECTRFIVDPNKYYGEAFKQAWAKGEIKLKPRSK